MVFFTGILMSHIPLILVLDNNSHEFNNDKILLLKKEITNNTLSSIEYASSVFYSVYLIILFTMVLILCLGLLLVIRLVLSEDSR